MNSSPPLESNQATSNLPTPPGPREAEVLAALRQVIDPEIGCNIVDLGLVYGIDLQPEIVRVAMTVTSPGCPMHDTLAHGVEAALRALEWVRQVEVRTVWDPPWNPSMIEPRVRALLGIGEV